ncbi:ABC transporter ATP-binding protein [Actinoplanes sp. N902-109]|uniref:ABC transporter transmembrane domain-containing protein n=1 Tax=Actinoplanes sp. (strain N902-109) TaxID=649831 RepID=UPI00032934C5|nr:ABC transporter ATP-binding protein [Actinoplanes sp. N902-109]AGL17151.1 ABC transporter ATP-binding protein/permease [Actinoplanes sp. N902-109]
MADRSTALLLRCVRAAGGWAVLLAVSCLAGAAAQLALPALLGRAVDAVLTPGRSSAWWLGAVVVLVLVAAAGEVLSDLAAGAGTARATRRLRHLLLDRLLGMPPAAVRRYPAGDLVTRMVSQATDAGTAATAVILGVASALPPVGSLVALTLIDPWLSGALVLGMLLTAVLLRGFAREASGAARGYQRVQGDIAGRLVEALAGRRTIAAAGTTGTELARVLRPLPELHEHGRATWQALAVAAGRTALLGPLGQIGVLITGGLLLTGGRLTPGELLAALQYAALGAGLGALLSTLNRLVRARTGAGRAAEILAGPPLRHGGRALPDGPGELRLRGVTVRSGSGTVLDRIDLTVPGGTALAVVGRSGAGKSTLAAVAGRLCDPDAGAVLLDGVPLPELSRAALAAAIGYGFERPFLLGDRIHDVIALDRPGTAGGFVGAAAATAAIDDYIDRLPRGRCTPLADAPMSGGEAQRLGLARALYGSRLLILDDASSSLDSATEARITGALTRPADGRTRLLVTHRRTVAQRCDLVAWLAGGRLLALAPHAELWTDPAYRALFAAESAGVGA